VLRKRGSPVDANRQAGTCVGADVEGTASARFLRSRIVAKANSGMTRERSAFWWCAGLLPLWRRKQLRAGFPARPPRRST